MQTQFHIICLLRAQMHCSEIKTTKSLDKAEANLRSQAQEWSKIKRRIKRWPSLVFLLLVALTQ